jgi:hypothetical protein
MAEHCSVPVMRPVGELMRKVFCHQPSRLREDDKIVELFLHSFAQARFASRPNWLPQSKRNVEVIVVDDAGTSLAIEHTRVFAFEDHKRQEELLRPIAELLEAEPRLSAPGRRYDLCFRSGSLEKLLRRHHPLVQQGLMAWALSNLPALAIRIQAYKFQIPIPLANGKVQKMDLDVEVSERDNTMRPVSVGGALPEGSQRLRPMVRKALNDKLEKLVAAETDQRILMAELPTTDSERLVVDMVRGIGAEFPLLKKVDRLAVAKTLGFHSEGVVFFHVWDLRAKTWCEHLEVVIRNRNG